MKRSSLTVHDAQLPPELEAVFKKRGADWTPNEKDSVMRWLNTYKLRYLLVFAIQYLGGYGTPEDAWQELMLEKWEGVVRNYDPAPQNDSSVEGSGRFLRYLRSSLRNVCRDIVKKSRKEEAACQAQAQEMETEGGDSIDIEFLLGIQAVEGDGDARQRLEEEEERARLGAYIGKALQRLARSDPRDHDVVVLFYFKEMSRKEIAATLNMSEVHVGVILFRGRKKLKRYLSQEGFAL